MSTIDLLLCLQMWCRLGFLFVKTIISSLFSNRPTPTNSSRAGVFFSNVSLFFWFLLASDGFLASVGFVTVGFATYRRMGRDYIELVLASGKFCFFLLRLLLLLFCCWWWWWWWERPGLHAASPEPSSSLQVLDMIFFFLMTLFDTLWFCFCCCYLLFVISFLVCRCWWFAVACYIFFCYAVRDNVCDVVII